MRLKRLTRQQVVIVYKLEMGVEYFDMRTKLI